MAKFSGRAGEEGANALGKQKTGLGKLRVRGMKAVKFAVTLKWLGVNILRASAFETARNDKNRREATNIMRSILFVWAWMRIG